MSQKFKNTLQSAIYPYLRGNQFSIMVTWDQDTKTGQYRIIRKDNDQFSTTCEYSGEKCWVLNSVGNQKQRAYGVLEAQIVDIFNIHLKQYNQPEIRLENISMRESAKQIIEYCELFKGIFSYIPKKDFRKKYTGIYSKMLVLRNTAEKLQEDILKNEDLSADITDSHHELLTLINQVGGIYPDNLPGIRFMIDDVILSQGNYKDMPFELRGMNTNQLYDYFLNESGANKSKDEFKQVKNSLEWVLNNVFVTPTMGKKFFEIYEGISKKVKKIQIIT